jgi:HSP20 family molecular chaperone IbpA
MPDQEITVAAKQETLPEKGEMTHEGVYFTPAVDIYETEKELTLLADMPGVDAESVEIDVRDDTLAITGKVGARPTEGTPLLAEYRVGNYFRRFTLSEAVDQSGITASLSDGVLKVSLPKAAKAVPRRIPISAG